MPDPQLRVKQHLNLQEIKRRKLACECAQERGRWYVIELMSRSTRRTQPMAASIVAGKTGYSPQRVRQLVHAYNEYGPNALKRKKPTNSRTKVGGRPTKLDFGELSILETYLEDERSPGGDAWTPIVVARWILEHTGKSVHEATARRYLDKLSPDWKVRRSEVIEKDEAAEATAVAQNGSILQPGLFDAL